MRALPALQTNQHLVGAHYYLWFPENFSHGFLRNWLVPTQQPQLGWYQSWDTKAIERHIAWCSRFGIDFLTLDWWPGRPDQNRIVQDAFLKANNIGDVRFCIFYETWALGFNSDYGCTEFTTNVQAQFVAELTAIADTFFKHPSYLRVGGRPVLVLYLSRTLTGDYASAIARFRAAARARGQDPFLIGDEVFWKVSPAGLPPGERPYPLVEAPQAARLRCFDAITAYNMYENGHATQRGYGAASTFVADVTAKFAEYTNACAQQTYFIPSVIPGYNDRGVRPTLDHYAIPRQWSTNAPDGSFLAECLDRLAFRFLDPRLNMLFITSWNEWNEDTAIEPLAPAEPTRRDASDTGDFFTQGYAYGGRGTACLEVIRDKVVAVCGRVTHAAGGKPAPGVTLGLHQGRTTLTARTDSRGYYRFPRLRLAPGPCRVALEGGRNSADVVIPADRAATDVNFTL